MSRFKNWLLLPLCTLAYLWNGNLWHLHVQRAAQQRKVVCIYSFKSELVRAEIKQVRKVVCVGTSQQDWDMQGKDKKQNAI